jgi:hypothetical protein
MLSFQPIVLNNIFAGIQLYNWSNYFPNQLGGTKLTVISLNGQCSTIRSGEKVVNLSKLISQNGLK